MGALLEPAWALASALEHTANYLPILHGLWVHFLTEGNLAMSVTWANQMLIAAASCGESDLEISGHRSMMASRFWLGDLVAAQRHATTIMATYDAVRHRHIADRTNNDPRTMVGIYGSHFLWMLGYPDQAMRECDDKNAHARRRNHPFDLGFALTLGSHAFDYCGDSGRLERSGDEAEQVGRERGVSLMSEIMAPLVKGVACLRAGRTMESIALLRMSIVRLRGTGHRIYITYLRAVLADAVAREGNVEEGLDLLEESLRQIAIQGERVHLAEVLRLKGWMLYRQGHAEAAEVELRASLAWAREQQAKSWELRTAATLARQLRERGHRAEAHGLLAPLFDWFTEGFETADLVEARELLGELNRVDQTESRT
ncbi:MAG: hypothetical protein ABI665_06640 [Vicinamibacterales bacterium]